MTEAYEEIVQGETVLRLAPDKRHETICSRLHEHVAASVQHLTATRLLPLRSIVQTGPGTLVRPDLALVTAATGKLWLAAEVINSRDHRIDTVMKKNLYEEIGLSRLWVVDPRYDNTEIYHGSPYGLVLKKILALREVLEEELLPSFQITMSALFQA
jgi:Uma2 family endonuclease